MKHTFKLGIEMDHEMKDAVVGSEESLMMVFFTFIFLSFRLPNTFGMECTEFCLEYPYFKRC